MAKRDRSRWDREAIFEGMTLLGVALRRTPVHPDPYVVQAAIAGCHAIAPTWAATPWDAIVSWYDVLVALTDTPVVRLNRAVALGERDGPASGLAALDEVAADGGLDTYAPLPASRAEVLTRLGRHAEAADACRTALALVLPAAQRRHVERLLARVGG